MRGMLQIASARSPYMRAALAWPSRDALVLDIRILDGDRLKELLDDPVLTVRVGRADGQFMPLESMLVGPFDAASLQLLIDSMADDLPPIGSGDPIADLAVLAVEDANRLTELLCKIEAAGFSSADQLIDTVGALQAGQAKLALVLQSAGVETVDGLIEKHRELVEINNAQAKKVVELTAAVDAHAKRSPKTQKPTPPTT